jgi:5-methylcytosine-specific restriction endonuclease McrA
MSWLEHIPKKVYKCQACGRVFYSLASIRGHAWKEHRTFRVIKRIK